MGTDTTTADGERRPVAETIGRLMTLEALVSTLLSREPDMPAIVAKVRDGFEAFVPRQVAATPDDEALIRAAFGHALASLRRIEQRATVRQIEARQAMDSASDR